VLAAPHGGVTLPEDVVRREAEIAVALAPAHEDIEGIVRKVTLLKGGLAEARQTQEVSEGKFRSLSDTATNGAR
jgi:hypothetical protein